MTNYAEQFAMSKYASSADRSAAMLAELERLTAERDAALQASRYESDLCGQALEDIKAATAERDALREDAERYRWLRNNPEWLGWDSDFQPDEVEREIDEARGVK